jgi:hypothetical protein
MSRPKFASRVADFAVVVLFLLLWAAYEVDVLRTFVLTNFWAVAVLVSVGLALTAYAAWTYWRRVALKRDGEQRKQ